jgi:phosphate/sulfate permease
VEFLMIAVGFGLMMLVVDSFEVGRNDAANITNAVFGARVMRRRRAALIAGAAVILGAVFSSPVMETARKGIFDPNTIAHVESPAETVEADSAEPPAEEEQGAPDFRRLIAVYISVYVVDTVLLYGFSAFGMPVSTTACLVFELVGASLFLGGFGVVSWGTVRKVVAGIIVSILVSGIASFLFQRMLRGAIRDKSEDRETVLLHGPWIAGGMLTFLTWFMVFKGLKQIEFIGNLKSTVFAEYGTALVLLFMWCIFTFAVHVFLATAGPWGTRRLFHITALLGMVCLAFAFGQNDLANAASPGLSAMVVYQNMDTTAELASQVPINKWWLLMCGLLMAAGMLTPYAQRVTRAAVNTGSQFDHVALYAPHWCRSLARWMMRLRRGRVIEVAPGPSLTDQGKKIHFDTLRASVIMAVSASVIAFASGHGLPVSTTYVAFAAILGTGMADRVFHRGEYDRKMGRAIWVVTCWFIAPVIAIGATGCVAVVIYRLGTAGLGIVLAVNIGVRFLVKRRSDTHERRFHTDLEHHDDDDKAPAPA